MFVLRRTVLNYPVFVTVNKIKLKIQENKNCRLSGENFLRGYASYVLFAVEATEVYPLIFSQSADR
jgi:hypothetical protein